MAYLKTFTQWPSSSRMRGGGGGGGGGLAKHALICHHQGVFVWQENKRKEKKREKTGELKASPPKIYCEVIDVHLLQTEAYICSEKGKL